MNKTNLYIPHGSHLSYDTWEDCVKYAISLVFGIDMEQMVYGYPVAVYKNGRGFRVWENEYLLIDENKSLHNALLASISSGNNYEFEEKPIPTCLK